MKEYAILRVIVGIAWLLSPPPGAAKSPESWAPMTDLAQEPYYGRRRELIALIETGATVDQQDDCGRTALMRAALGAEYQCARILLDFGAGVDLGDENGFTALVLACGGFTGKTPSKTLGGRLQRRG